MKHPPLKINQEEQKFLEGITSEVTDDFLRELHSGNTCNILIPFKDAVEMEYDKAIELALKETKKSDREVGFIFVENKENGEREIITPIRIGNCIGIELKAKEEMAFEDEFMKFGSFHTHPIHTLSDYDKLKKPSETLNDYLCSFSNLDLQIDRKNNINISVIGCTTSPFFITEQRKIGDIEEADYYILEDK